MNNPHSTADVARVEALRDLVQHRTSVDDATRALARFPFDSDDELVPLTRADAVHLLDQYLRGLAAADEVRRWAEALEVRDDVGREPGFEDTLNELLFELATPEAAGPLTTDAGQSWVTRLTS
ncbi:hypothetical protein [Amycolatopsis dongchuanensis]|uniref:Uncharacterized protein n=1 Tax=Amycolatopsis dongchuanensis TaxID=1070866 RepID=A0ABP8VPX3_9PSEU